MKLRFLFKYFLSLVLVANSSFSLALSEDCIKNIDLWNIENIEKNIKTFCSDNKINLGKLAQPLRATLTGKSVSPGLYEVIMALGKEKVLERINILDK